MHTIIYYKLTTPQTNIWNLQKFYADTSIQNVCGAILFNGLLDTKRLEQAINEEIRLQNGLRLRFCEENGNPVQYIDDYIYSDIDFKEFDSEKDFFDFTEKYAKKQFSLNDSQMYRFMIVKVCDKSGFIACASHLISDAWTFSLLAKDVYNLYHTPYSEKNDNLFEYSYAAYIESEEKYFSSERCKKDRTFWQEKYPVKPEPSHVKMMQKNVDIPTANRFSKVLTADQTSEIDTFCLKNNISQAVLFETAVISYLKILNPENTSVTVGIPVLNRTGVYEKNTAGMFISTMPLTIAVSDADTVSLLCEKVSDSHKQVFRHQKYPYSRILQDIRDKSDFFGNLYDVMVSFQNAKTDTDGKTYWFSNGYSEIPLTVHIDNRDSTDCYTLTLDYQTEVFRQDGEIALLTDRLMHIIKQIISDGGITVGELSVLPKAEYQKIIYDFNDTAADYPRDKCVHELFEEQAAETPDKIALVASDKSLTYNELNLLSNRIANALLSQGIDIGNIVAFSLQRKSYLIAVIIGILKVGGVYMPIDSEYPEERKKYLLSDSNAKLYITEENLAKYLSFTDESNPDLNLKSNKLCYCIYTSGSTGNPKGTLLFDKGIVNLLSCRGLYNNLDYCDKIGLLTTISFDVATQEIFTALLNAKTGFLMGDKSKLSIDDVISFIEKNKIDMIFCTPSYFNILTSKIENAKRLASVLKCVNLAGEKFYLNNEFLSADKNDNCIVNNQYGPAETHVISVSMQVKNYFDITIGKPIANTQIYILDGDSNPLPIGAAGELCIAGDGVGAGYLNRPELTAERFVENPFATEKNGHGKTMYHTGDLARWRADGEIEYLGRIDTQVKIRGLRIELGEIESVMAGFPGIELCAVTDKRDENGRQYLAGYYTSGKDIDEKALRAHLAAKLPRYMIPNYFMHLSEMPMTPSGKTDRKNLPVPEFTVTHAVYAEPETQTEIRTAGIWSELLNAENIGREDDFFELGGDSLLAISLLSRLETEFDADVTMKDIMENSVLRDMAAMIERADTRSVKITARNKDRYVLLPQQKTIYAVCSKDPDTLTYNMPAFIPLPENIDRDKLKTCFRKLPDIHRSLKTYIKAEKGDIYGIYDESAEIRFEEYPDGDSGAFVRPFNLSEAPLVRAAFTADGMLVDIHHIISDGEGLNIILRDLAALYNGVSFTTPEIQYSDYAEYFISTDFTKHREYFKCMLKCDFEPVVLPETGSGTGGGISAFYNIGRDIFNAGKEYARNNGLTDTMLHLGVFGILLSKYSAKNDILSSIILTNRTHSETAGTVGMFVNTLPVYLSAKGTVKEYFAAVKELLLNLYEYQELPFPEIAQAVKMDDITAVNTSFVYQADGEKRLYAGGAPLVPEFIDTHTAKFGLSFELVPNENGCTVRIEYDRSRYDRGLADRLYASYIRIMEQLSAENISDINVLSDEEYQKVIHDFNDTAADYPRERCVHELFEEQAAETPEKIALVFEDKRFTYREIDEMSNSLAHYLRDKGVKPNDVVPIISKRDWRTIVAMFGIMKAGGAYLLLPTDYPVDRINYMIGISKSKFALIYGYGRNLDIPAINLSNFDYGYNTNALFSAVLPDDIYCVIHTSGSTGMPKLSALKHKGICNYASNSGFLFDGIETSISFTSIVFDAFILDTVIALLNGTMVVLASENETSSQHLFEKILADNKKITMFSTPTKLKTYLENQISENAFSNVCSFILGGEFFTDEMKKLILKKSSSRAYNCYGPTETTINSTISQVIDKNNRYAKTDITIGKPIANTQIYILDGDSNPLPIGAAGELCIAGDGVGAGYLNRPELTAERFVENPFATEKNGHGKTMYRTGDLARWRADGEIEYLGRIDTQVKIRGLRIELGEIESVMAGFPGIELCAVTDKKDENGRQYLAGYYTSGKDIDEKALRAHLAAKLPKYMIPNYFMHLSEMPMTPSGKTDRKNLPVPQINSASEEYVPPETELERTLCELSAGILEIERMGATDDFFDFGGDSLRAIEYVAKAHNAGIEFTLQSVFDFPTVRGLCGFIENGAEKKAVYSARDFDKFNGILSRNVIDENFVPVKKPLGNVLLTGATGFLGAHVLDSLMKNENGRIYCLVRSSSEDDRRGRLREILSYYFGSVYESEIGRRIIPIVGDIGQTGLSHGIPRDVQTVIHTAASVKHYGSYSYFYNVNVNGTVNVINYAKSCGAGLIHISTLSVSGNSLADEFEVYRAEEEKGFDETCLFIGQPLENVYIHSKFEAEAAVLDAVLDGLDAKIIRVGNLTNRQSDYKFQPNYRSNAFLTRVKAALEMGLFPDYLLPLYSEFSPIDVTAEGIVKIAQYAGRQNVFHLNSNKPIYFDRLLDVLHSLDIKMEVVGGKTFNDTLQQLARANDTEYIYEAFQNDMDENGQLVYDTNIRIKNDFTVWFLEKINMSWPQTDYGYIKGYIDYFRDLGYLEV